MTAEPIPFTNEEIAGQLRVLGVHEGGVLLVHTSYRAVRPVEGGPEGLVRALRLALGPAGTLVMPSWGEGRVVPFDRAHTAASRGLGVVADRFWRMPGVRRTQHAHAFAAVGPAAGHVLSDPLPLPPHIPESPVGRVYEMDGQVLLLGVGHDADTTLHLAELLGGAPYRIPKSLTVLREGRLETIEYGENDHCGRRFVLADGWLRDAGLQAEGPVGNARARLCRSRDIVDVALRRLSTDPLFFLHDRSERCGECDEARRSV